VKLLYLTPGCFDKGGISRYSRYQIAAWRDLLGGENVRALSLHGPDGNSFEEPFDVAYAAGGAGPAAKARFAAHAAGETAWWHPDIVHAAHINLSGLGCALAALRGAIPILNVYGLEVWSGLRRDAAWGLSRSRFVISDCHFTARYLEGEGLRPAGSIRTIWDCVDTGRFTPAAPSRDVLERYGLPDSRRGPTLMTLGRMSVNDSHKGYERLLEVFGRIAEAAPDLNLVYGGHGNLVETLRQRAAASGLGSRVYFTGPVHERDLADVYRSAHIFSLVSDRGKGRGEGIPLTPLEAAACGVPILVGNQDGSQEAVVEGQNGYVLDPFDFEVHARAILRLVREPDCRLRMAEAARKRIEDEFAYPIFRDKHRHLLALIRSRFTAKAARG